MSKYVKPKFSRLEFDDRSGFESLCSIVSKCELCGWAMIDVCCNFEDVLDVADKVGEDSGDWMTYCLNKGCENHLGIFYSGGGKNNLGVLKQRLL